MNWLKSATLSPRRISSLRRWDTHTPLRKPSQVSIGRIATWLDSEGTIRDGGIVIHQQNPACLYWIQKMLEYGTVAERSDGCWYYRLTGRRRVYQLLTWCLPYLFTKKHEAKEWLDGTKPHYRTYA